MSKLMQVFLNNPKCHPKNGAKKNQTNRMESQLKRERDDERERSEKKHVNDEHHVVSLTMSLFSCKIN